MNIKRGDRFVWSGDEAAAKVRVEVRRVSRDLSWADLRCSAGNAIWSKRQPLPLPDSFVREVS